MNYVIVEKENNIVRVHGPFYLERAAQAYLNKLFARNPQNSYNISYLYPEDFPEKNL